jgi:hypothetical protein
MVSRFPRHNGATESEPRHQCLIYSGSPSQQLPALAAVIRQKLDENYRCLYLNSPEMVEEMRACLAVKGVDAARETAEGSLLLVSDLGAGGDAAFDQDQMIKNLEDAVKQALADGHAGLFATGDMTWELGSARDSFGKLLAYEWKLEKLFRRQPALSGICQYHADTLPIEIMRQGLVSHRALFINQTLSHVNQFYAEDESAAERDAGSPALDTAVAGLCQT